MIFSSNFETKADLTDRLFERQRVSVSAVSENCWTVVHCAMQLLSRQGNALQLLSRQSTFKLTSSAGVLLNMLELHVTGAICECA